MLHRLLPFAALLLILPVTAHAQDIGIGQWRTHLPYTDGNQVAEAGSTVYCGTSTGLYSYSPQSGEFGKYDKTHGFSGTGIHSLAYNAPRQTLVIAYDDTNIDLLKGNEIVNMPEIRNFSVTGEKRISNITMHGDTAILSCSFGVVLLDVEKELIKTDIKFSDDINFAGIKCFDAAYLSGYFYFATSDGVYRVAENINIKNLSNWEQLPGIAPGYYNHIVSFGNKVYFNYSAALTDSTLNADTVYTYDGAVKGYFDPATPRTVTGIESGYGKLLILSSSEFRVLNPAGTVTEIVSCFTDARHALPGNNGKYWLASAKGGLFGIEGGSCTNHYLDGPYSARVQDMSIVNGNIWVASGTFNNNYNNGFNADGLYYRIDNDWKKLNIPDFGFETPHLDIYKLYVDPSDAGHVYAGSWGTGLYEISGYNASITQLTASPLDVSAVGLKYRIGGITKDADGNLWITNSNTAQPLKRKSADGTWTGFAIPGVTTALASGEVLVDDIGNVWTSVYGKGIAVRNLEDNTTRMLTGAFNDGELPNLYIRTMVSDKDGQVWIGSENGVRIISPGQVFTDPSLQAQKIVITAEDGNNELLLNETVINDIVVDGGNRKWIATDGSGVRLVSDDGRTIIRSFTAENSPLLSNVVKVIAIDAKTGEVYFGTDKGIVSYRSDAIEGGNSFGNVYAYPNPVEPGYDGPIAITGMAVNSLVKITDISGNLVYETTSEGGQATWNGKRYDGHRPQTGVYLVFCVNEDASETMITKILFIN